MIMAEIKCPCGLRNHMEEEDCKKTNCNACCPLTKPQTNADRIRAMSDEELAEFLCGVYDEENGGVYQDECGKFINGVVIFDYDQYKIAEWLKQPAEE
jgi:hypothetical protein